MRLVDKYIFRSFFAPLLYCLFIFISIYCIVDLFGHLDEIIREKIGIITLFIYYLAYIPRIIVEVMPVSMLIATMYTLENFIRHNEISALRASGIGIWDILKPFLITGLLVSSIVLIISDKVAPKSMQVSLKIKVEQLEKQKGDHWADRIIKNVAMYGKGNKIIYAKRYDPRTKILKDIIIHEHDRGQNITAKSTAKEARWTSKGWLGSGITTYKLDNKGDIKEEPRFIQKGVLDIKETPEELRNQKSRTEVLSFSELRSYVKRFSGTSNIIMQNLLIEMHSRISYPFANVIVVLIGAAFCLMSRRKGRMLGVGLGFVIGLFFYGVLAISLALGRGGALPPVIAAWSANVIFGSLGIYLINKY